MGNHVLDQPELTVASSRSEGSVLSRLFRTKSIPQILAEAEHPDHRLRKTLTAWDLTCLGIGAIIGTGIFVLIGTAVSPLCGLTKSAVGPVVSVEKPVVKKAFWNASGLPD